MLYDAAIQTGPRANELRSLTNGRLYLDGERPYITCKAGSTKNRKHAKQYILCELASQLRDHVVKKAKARPVFKMPHKYDVADMLRQDLPAARQARLEAVKHDSEERDRREQSDFLLAKNHEGEEIDFHALRHTCGAWLSAAGVHPKTVQTIMRHQSITLTMDTYGHLFPGQKADAVAKMDAFASRIDEALQATGLTGEDQAGAQRQRQQSGRETMPESASGCDEPGVAEPDTAPTEEARNLLRVASLGDGMRDNSKAEGTGLEPVGNLDGTDNCDCTCEFCQGYRAANALHLSDAGWLESSSLDTDLQNLISRWELLPPIIRNGIMALIDSQIHS